MTASKFSAVLLLNLAATACGPVPVQVFGEVQGSQVFEPIPPGQPIAVYWDDRAMPPGEAKAVGRIVAETTEGGWEDLMDAMKQKARAMGANALRITSSSSEPAGKQATGTRAPFFGSASVQMLYRKMREAIALRYEKAPSQ